MYIAILRKGMMRFNLRKYHKEEESECFSFLFS